MVVVLAIKMAAKKVRLFCEDRRKFSIIQLIREEGMFWGRRLKKITAVNVLVIIAVTMSVYLFGVNHGRTGEGLSVIKVAVAAETKSPASPVIALSERDVYYPGSEDMAPDEMRVIACGTGMPNARPKQAAACRLVELGNGDKFLFDIGLFLRAHFGTENPLRLS